MTLSSGRPDSLEIVSPPSGNCSCENPVENCSTGGDECCCSATSPVESISKTWETLTVDPITGKPSEDAYVRVKQAVPFDALDSTALTLKVGDVVRVAKIRVGGHFWEGELLLGGGKFSRVGHFPCANVELIDHDEPGTASCPASGLVTLVQKDN